MMLLVFRIAIFTDLFSGCCSSGIGTHLPHFHRELKKTHQQTVLKSSKIIKLMPYRSHGM